MDAGTSQRGTPAQELSTAAAGISFQYVPLIQCSFPHAGEVVPGIAQVLKLIPDPEAAWDFLSEESAFIEPDTSMRPIEGLRQGKVDAVVAAAHSFLEAFS